MQSSLVTRLLVFVVQLVSQVQILQLQPGHLRTHGTGQIRNSRCFAHSWDYLMLFWYVKIPKKEMVTSTKFNVCVFGKMLYSNQYCSFPNSLLVKFRQNLFKVKRLIDNIVIKNLLSDVLKVVTCISFFLKRYLANLNKSQYLRTKVHDVFLQVL